MPISRRNINSAILRMVKETGRQIACYWRDNLPIPPRVPTDIYDNTSSPDIGDVTLYYIFATFQQTVTENPVGDAGSVGIVKGYLIIPYQYRDIINRTEYFDPYLNGSKFLKDGAAIDDQGITITQAIRSEYLPVPGEVQ